MKLFLLSLILLFPSYHWSQSEAYSPHIKTVDYSSDFSLHPLDSAGCVLEHSSALETLGNKITWYFETLDEDLSSIALDSLEIPKKYKRIHSCFNEYESFTFFLKPSGDFKLIKVNGIDGKLNVYSGDIEQSINVKNIFYCDSKIIFNCSYRSKPHLISYDLVSENQSNMSLPGIDPLLIKPNSVLDFQILEGEIVLFLYLYAYSLPTNLAIFTMKDNGTIELLTTYEDQEFHLSELRSMRNGNGDYAFCSTLSEKLGYISKGLCSGIFSQGEFKIQSKIMFSDFTGLMETVEPMKQMDHILKKRKLEKKGKEYPVYENIIVNDLIPHKNGYLFFAEGYSGRVVGVQSGSSVDIRGSVGLWTTSSKKVDTFSQGVKFPRAFVLSINENGEMIWNQTINTYSLIRYQDPSSQLFSWTANPEGIKLIFNSKEFVVFDAQGIPAYSSTPTFQEKPDNFSCTRRKTLNFQWTKSKRIHLIVGELHQKNREPKIHLKVVKSELGIL